MNGCFASFNSKGFASSLQYGHIPENDHITYEGAFNELCYSIGPKAKKSLELHYGICRCQNIESCFDDKVNDYLTIFTKGSSDGEERDERVLNSVVCLDISGSMGGSLSRDGKGHRLTLAKEAIKMYFSRMRDTDAFGLVVFENTSDVVIECKMKKDHDEEQVFSAIEKIHTRGGTTMRTGFELSRKELLRYFEAQHYSQRAKAVPRENRIVMLTDVCDNEVAQQEVFIQEVSTSEDIHTTVIGISDDFRSSTCERLNEIRGFNYFCATEVSDLKKYLFENFNYTFFPANYDIQIELVSNGNIRGLEVFGTVDSKRVRDYNNNFEGPQEKFILTKTKTSFPSEIEISEKGHLKQFGGLIVVKLDQVDSKTVFESKLKVTYLNPDGQKGEETYDLSFNLPKDEQFYSDGDLSDAMSAFFYVYEVKNILTKIKNLPNKEKAQFLPSLEKLKALCPESKKKELQDLIDVLKKYQENETKTGIESEETLPSIEIL